MHGLVTLDEADQATAGPFWERRPFRKGDRSSAYRGGDYKLSACTANIAFTGFTLQVVDAGNEPENFKRIRRLCCQNTIWHTVCQAASVTDYRNVPVCFYGLLKNKCWSEENDGAVRCEPGSGPSHQVINQWELSKGQVAEELGFSQCQAAGAGDNGSAAVGTGTREGECRFPGNKRTIFISSQDFKGDENNALHAFCHAECHFHLMDLYAQRCFL